MVLHIVTWNVNSIRVRLEAVQKFLRAESPDVLLLQETKCEAPAFPDAIFLESGYRSIVRGQKSYNGVAILYKDSLLSLESFDFLESIAADARTLEASFCFGNARFKVMSLYVPLGDVLGSEKHRYKCTVYERLFLHLEKNLVEEQQMIVGGDLNVAVDPIDVYDSSGLQGSVCFEQITRDLLRRILNLGYYDIFRNLYPEKRQFSWWDYRNRAWQNNQGMRLDYLLASPNLMEKVEASVVHERFRGLERASDHVPVSCVLEI